MDASQGKRAKAAHVWTREDDDFYVEPSWCSQRLFDVEDFDGGICDPAAGMCRILSSALAIDQRTSGSDVVARVPGYPVRDFFGEDFSLDGCANVVTNPPFDRLEAFARHACTIAPRKAAMIAPTARLNAARWLEQLPLVRVWLMTPRPSMGPGRMAMQGVEARGDTKDYCWLIFDRTASIRTPELRWLHKNGNGGRSVDRGRGAATTAPGMRITGIEDAGARG